MHRLRLKFARKDRLKFLSHLDMMRLWERALRRAGLSLVYSEGFSPHPQISMAAPLAVGVTGLAELMDVYLQHSIPINEFLQKIRPQLPDGVEILEVTVAGIEAPSLQSRIRFAEYSVEVQPEKSPSDILQDINNLLSTKQLPWHHARDTGERFYDLRELIDDVWMIAGNEGKYTIGMRLRCDPSRSGRPEQVVKALGLTQVPVSIQRTKLILA